MDAFYSRNHGPFPDIAPQHWRMRVDGMVDNRSPSHTTNWSTGSAPTRWWRPWRAPATDGRNCCGCARYRARTPGPMGRSRPPNGVEPGWQTSSKRQESITMTTFARCVQRSRRGARGRPRPVLRQLHPVEQGHVAGSAAGLGDEFRTASTRPRWPGAGRGAGLYRGAQRQVGHCHHASKRSRRRTTFRPATIASFRLMPTPTPRRPARAFRCRRCRSTATSWSPVTTPRFPPAR